jgi:hypothetical protein
LCPSSQRDRHGKDDSSMASRVVGDSFIEK